MPSLEHCSFGLSSKGASISIIAYSTRVSCTNGLVYEIENSSIEQHDIFSNNDR